MDAFGRSYPSLDEDCYIKLEEEMPLSGYPLPLSKVKEEMSPCSMDISPAHSEEEVSDSDSLEVIDLQISCDEPIPRTEDDEFSPTKVLSALDDGSPANNNGKKQDVDMRFLHHMEHSQRRTQVLDATLQTLPSTTLSTSPLCAKFDEPSSIVDGNYVSCKSDVDMRVSIPKKSLTTTEMITSSASLSAFTTSPYCSRVSKTFSNEAYTPSNDSALEEKIEVKTEARNITRVFATKVNFTSVFSYCLCPKKFAEVDSHLYCKRCGECVGFKDTKLHLNTRHNITLKDEKICPLCQKTNLSDYEYLCHIYSHDLTTMSRLQQAQAVHDVINSPRYYALLSGINLANVELHTDVTAAVRNSMRYMVTQIEKDEEENMFSKVASTIKLKAVDNGDFCPCGAFVEGHVKCRHCNFCFEVSSMVRHMTYGHPSVFVKTPMKLLGSLCCMVCMTSYKDEVAYVAHCKSTHDVNLVAECSELTMTGLLKDSKSRSDLKECVDKASKRVSALRPFAAKTGSQLQRPVSALPPSSETHPPSSHSSELIEPPVAKHEEKVAAEPIDIELPNINLATARVRSITVSPSRLSQLHPAASSIVTSKQSLSSGTTGSSYVNTSSAATSSAVTSKAPSCKSTAGTTSLTVCTFNSAISSSTSSTFSRGAFSKRPKFSDAPTSVSLSVTVSSHVPTTCAMKPIAPAMSVSSSQHNRMPTLTTMATPILAKPVPGLRCVTFKNRAKQPVHALHGRAVSAITTTPITSPQMATTPASCATATGAVVSLSTSGIDSNLTPQISVTSSAPPQPFPILASAMSNASAPSESSQACKLASDRVTTTTVLTSLSTSTSAIKHVTIATSNVAGACKSVGTCPLQGAGATSAAVSSALSTVCKTSVVSSFLTHQTTSTVSTVSTSVTSFSGSRQLARSQRKPSPHNALGISAKSILHLQNRIVGTASNSESVKDLVTSHTAVVTNSPPITSSACRETQQLRQPTSKDNVDLCEKAAVDSSINANNNENCPSVSTMESSSNENSSIKPQKVLKRNSISSQECSSISSEAVTLENNKSIAVLANLGNEVSDVTSFAAVPNNMPMFVESMGSNPACPSPMKLELSSDTFTASQATPTVEASALQQNGTSEHPEATADRIASSTEQSDVIIKDAHEPQRRNTQRSISVESGELADFEDAINLTDALGGELNTLDLDRIIENEPLPPTPPISGAALDDALSSNVFTPVEIGEQMTFADINELVQKFAEQEMEKEPMETFSDMTPMEVKLTDSSQFCVLCERVMDDLEAYREHLLDPEAHAKDDSVKKRRLLQSELESVGISNEQIEELFIEHKKVLKEPPLLGQSSAILCTCKVFNTWKHVSCSHCKACVFIESELADYHNHIYERHLIIRPGTHKCRHCGETFQKKKMAVRHTSVHYTHFKPATSSPSCESAVSAAPPPPPVNNSHSHLLACDCATRPGWHQLCMVCKLCFDPAIGGHDHATNDDLTCTVCDKVFANRSNLIRHYRMVHKMTDVKKSNSEPSERTLREKPPNDPRKLAPKVRLPKGFTLQPSGVFHRDCECMSLVGEHLHCIYCERCMRPDNLERHFLMHKMLLSDSCYIKCVFCERVCATMRDLCLHLARLHKYRSGWWKKRKELLTLFSGHNKSIELLDLQKKPDRVTSSKDDDASNNGGASSDSESEMDRHTIELAPVELRIPDIAERLAARGYSFFEDSGLDMRPELYGKLGTEVRCPLHPACNIYKHRKELMRSHLCEVHRFVFKYHDFFFCQTCNHASLTQKDLNSHTCSQWKAFDIRPLKALPEASSPHKFALSHNDLRSDREVLARGYKLISEIDNVIDKCECVKVRGRHFACPIDKCSRCAETPDLIRQHICARHELLYKERPFYGCKFCKIVVTKEVHLQHHSCEKKKLDCVRRARRLYLPQKTKLQIPIDDKLTQVCKPYLEREERMEIVKPASVSSRRRSSNHSDESLRSSLTSIKDEAKDAAAAVCKKCRNIGVKYEWLVMVKPCLCDKTKESGLHFHCPMLKCRATHSAGNLFLHVKKRHKMLTYYCPHTKVAKPRPRFLSRKTLEEVVMFRDSRTGIYVEKQNGEFGDIRYDEGQPESSGSEDTEDYTPVTSVKATVSKHRTKQLLALKAEPCEIKKEVKAEVKNELDDVKSMKSEKSEISASSDKSLRFLCNKCDYRSRGIEKLKDHLLAKHDANKDQFITLSMPSMNDDQVDTVIQDIFKVNQSQKGHLKRKMSENSTSPLPDDDNLKAKKQRRTSQTFGLQSDDDLKSAAVSGGEEVASVISDVTHVDNVDPKLAAVATTPLPPLPDGDLLQYFDDAYLWTYLMGHFCMCPCGFAFSRDDTSLYYTHISLHYDRNSLRCRTCHEEFPDGRAFITHTFKH